MAYPLHIQNNFSDIGHCAIHRKFDDRTQRAA